MQSLCAAFALGLNYYLAKHPETKPRLITHFEPWHVLAYGRQMHARAVLPLHAAVAQLPAAHARSDLDRRGLQRLGHRAAAARKSGHAMLFVNPHLPWFGFSQMYEAHLRSDEGWNFTGATLFGNCMPTLGHNEHLGWTLHDQRARHRRRVARDVRRSRASAALSLRRRLSRGDRVDRDDQDPSRRRRAGPRGQVPQDAPRARSSASEDDAALSGRAHRRARQRADAAAADSNWSKPRTSTEFKQRAGTCSSFRS